MKNATAIETGLKNNLTVLSELINKELGFSPKLDLNIDGRYFLISSDELLSELGSTLAKTIFVSIKIKMTSDCTVINNAIWFDAKLKYEHPNGGSNGTEFLWKHLGFDLVECKWIPGNTIF